jgi:two-component system response regulator YesN
VKLMIVDDEPKIRNGLLKLLGAREGWQVTGVFEDALSALTALYDDEADVIVTDIKMPEVSGLELIRQIRERNQDIHIVILSGHSNFAYAQKAIELGVTRYLLKPTNPRELIAVLEGIEKELNQGREAAMDGKQLSREAEAGPAADGDGVGNLLVQKAIQYVEVHYGGRITLKDMSEELHLSPNYLCELFKRHTGKNLMEYVTEYRMMKARTYLNHVEYKVSDVAEMVGYKEAKYFSSTFKKIYGMTPLEYRNKR